jgi:lysophospholipase L1-like esterase
MFKSCAAILLGPLLTLSAASTEHWVGTWATAVVTRPQAPRPGPGEQPAPPANPAPGTQPAGLPAALSLNNQTLREIVHVSIGGSRVRVVLSNEFGTAPLTIGAASIALRDKDAKIAASSNRALVFSGRPSVTIPAGASMVSDPVDENVPPMGDLAIDLYLPDEMTPLTSPLSVHAGASQTNYVSSTGNFAGSADLPVLTTTPSWYLLERVEVAAPAETGAIVTFGDSITDGARSTPNTNNRWPDHLAKRLLAGPGNARLAVLNTGIGGNRLLSDSIANFGINALARFDRDVLAQPGAMYVVVLEGINDIGNARANPLPSARDLIAAEQQIIERAHAHGLIIFGATLTPFEGAAYFSPEGEAKRQEVNTWIRTSKAYDGVIDFDAATRDPASLGKFLALYDSGDHLHPNDAGYEAMGKAINLHLFAPGKKRH